MSLGLPVRRSRFLYHIENSYSIGVFCTRLRSVNIYFYAFVLKSVFVHECLCVSNTNCVCVCVLLTARCMKGDALSYMEDLAGPMNQNFTLTETYCGEMSPGPYVTSRALKMLFRSDDVDSYVGFKADYVFVKTRDMDKCELGYFLYFSAR